MAEIDSASPFSILIFISKYIFSGMRIVTFRISYPLPNSLSRFKTFVIAYLVENTYKLHAYIYPVVGKNYVKDIYKKLKMAYAKLLIAENMRRNRSSHFSKSLYMLAATGSIFATPEFMANIYFSSSISDVKKARKIIEKALKKGDIPLEKKLMLEELNSVLKLSRNMKIYDLKIMITEALKILESAPLI